MSLPAIVPWEVAEVVSLRLAKLAPTTIWIVGPDHGRIRRMVTEGLEPIPRVELAVGPPDRAKRAGALHEALVRISDGRDSSAGARQDLLAAARYCVGDVVIVEPIEPGCGVGPELLHRIDPGCARMQCDELTAKGGTTRRRKPWEGPARWVVAQVAAWRFAPDAEAVRAGFRTRLPRMDAAQVVLACRRIHQRYGRAFEVFALAAEELGRRGDRQGVHQVQAELVMTGGGPQGVRGRVRHAVVSTWSSGGDWTARQAG